MNAITINNYPNVIKSIGLSKLNQGQKEAHELIVEASDNFKNLSQLKDLMSDPDIKEMVDMYFKQLEKFSPVTKESEKKPKAKVSVSKKSGPAKKKTTAKKSSVKTKRAKPTGRQAKSSKLKARSAKVKAHKKKPVVRKTTAKSKATLIKKQEAKPAIQIKRYSVELALIRRMLNMVGKQKTYRSIELLHMAVKKGITSGKVKDHKGIVSKIASGTNTIMTAMKKSKLDLITVNLKEETKKSMQKIVQGATERLRVSYLSGVNTKTKRAGGGGEKKSVVATVNKVATRKRVTPSNSTVFSGKDGFVRADQRKIVKAPNTFRLKGPIGDFLGDLQAYKLAITISGPRGSGKTYFTMDLANEFINAGYDVGFFSIEQGGLESKDTRAAIDSGISAKNQKYLAVTGEVKNGIDTVKLYADRFDVVIIDSWQKLGLPNTDFDRLRQEHPKTIWVVIFQLNAEGGMRNGVAAEFDAPVVLKAISKDASGIDNYIVAEKNRGNQIDQKYMIQTKGVKPMYEANEKERKKP